VQVVFSLPAPIASTDIAGTYTQFTETKTLYQSYFNEWVTAASQYPNLTKKSPYSVIYFAPRWRFFVCVWPRGSQKKKCKYHLLLFLNREIQAQRGKKQGDLKPYFKFCSLFIW